MSTNCYGNMFGLSCLLLTQLLPALLAAQPAPPAVKLKIITLEGEAGINNIRQRTTQVPTVRVEDENQRPAIGALVVFTLPAQGAGGTFTNGAKTLTVATDQRGVASARGLKPNSVAGKMEIHVNASYQGQMASSVITQFNMAVPAAKRGSGKVIAVLAIIGAAAAGGAYAGLHKSGAASSATSSTLPPIGLTPGAGTVGPPQ
jgi:hypothetical protein